MDMGIVPDVLAVEDLKILFAQYARVAEWSNAPVLDDAQLRPVKAHLPQAGYAGAKTGRLIWQDVEGWQSGRMHRS